MAKTDAAKAAAGSAKNLLFVCYSHTDQKYRAQFESYLKADALKGMDFFADTQIEPGDQWQAKILEKLAQANAALILISQETLISPFIQQVELRSILESHVSRGLRLFLVPLAPTLFQGSALEKFQWALPPDKPLSSMSESEQKSAMVEVCLRIARQFGTLPDAQTIERTIECLKNVPRLDLPSTYELQEPLGEGLYSRCFRGKDRLMNRPVIIKILNTPLTRESAAYDKYVESASRLDHRNILGIYFSEANKLPNFIVTPDVGDVTLEKKMSDPDPAKRPTMSDAIKWTRKLASTLNYAHGRNCVHGRIRPCEVRFDRSQPILAGFRTCESCEKQKKSASVTAHRLDLEDFRYASPEYREQGVVSPKGDQYLLGLIAYEMIAGVSPVALASWASLLDPAVAAALLNPPPLKDVVPACDSRVSDVVMRMLSVDPEARWPSMKHVEERLEDALTNSSSIAAAKESYRRVAQDPVFCAEVYQRLFANIDGIEAMFKRPMVDQQAVLRDALWLLLTFPSTMEHGEPTILSRIAHTHAHYPTAWFDTFQEVVLRVVAERDPGALDAWRNAMAPGFAYLKEHAGAAAGV